MDTAKLIEEAGREIAHMKAEALSAANPYTESTIRLTLIIDLVAALKASEERARKAEDERDEIAAGLRSSSNLNFAMRQERDALAAANLAANKRIVELEQERDEARSKLSRLTTPRPIAEAPKDERSRILARGRDGQWREMRLVRGEWRWFGAGNEHIESPTEYLPLPVLP